MPAVHHPNRCGNQLIPKKPHASRDEESEEIGLPTSHAILVLSVETLAGEQPPASQGASGTRVAVGRIAGHRPGSAGPGGRGLRRPRRASTRPNSSPCAAQCSHGTPRGVRCTRQPHRTASGRRLASIAVHRLSSSTGPAGRPVDRARHSADPSSWENPGAGRPHATCQ